MEITKNIQYTIATVGVLGIVAGYLLYKKSKKKEMGNMHPPAVTTSSGKPIKVSRMGSRTAKVLEEPNWKDPFDMKYTKDVKDWLRKPIKELSPKIAKQYARNLKNAKRRFNDDEAAVGRVFKRLKDKTQIATLSKAFFDLYKVDMWKHLDSFLSTKEMERYVSRFKRKLPNYRLA
ncbi:hypothetical protein [Aquimarina longa]|uniref:hypothetical protein n=1 Tax=Aquimarina longa TaxID=1080221 RepID=UPI000784BEA4|nr:hypothetical protein [Aquimarina longa]